jgi:hypothetical protein
MDYNLQEHNIDHIIKEIIAFYNWNHSLKNELKHETFNKGKYMELYAISKNWLDDWIKHTKYNLIEDYLNKNNKKELSQDEYFKFNEDKQSLFLNGINSDINNIYNNDNKYADLSINNLYNLNCLSFIDKKCFDIFSFGINDENSKIKTHGLYKKNKLIISPENNCYHIEDYSDNSKKECNIFFDDSNKRISLIVDEIINADNLYNFFKSAKIGISNDFIEKKKNCI